MKRALVFTLLVLASLLCAVSEAGVTQYTPEEHLERKSQTDSSAAKFLEMSGLGKGDIKNKHDGVKTRLIEEKKYLNLNSGSTAEWTWQNPLRQGNSLLGVWGNSGSDVFAVGEAGTIFYYDGSSWSPMNSGTTSALWDIWGSSGSDVFAVGEAGTILHYDGSSWSPITSVYSATFFGVWGSSGSDVFAVGEAGTILHYDGSSWSPMNSGTTNALWDIWGSSGSDVFVVGEAGTILHYDGSSFSSITSVYNVAFFGVWGSSGSDVFAVGEAGTILHYDGSSFSSISIPNVAFFGVWGSSGSDVFVVGEAGTILHYDGSSFSSISIPNVAFFGVWGSSGSDVFVVGENGAILHFYATEPTVTTTVVSSITSTSASSGGNVTSYGGSSITARGVCWSTAANPTVALSTKTDEGATSTTGEFTSNITGLSPNTKYYVRAYATNIAGTAYGSEVNFTTNSTSVLYVSSDGNCGINAPCHSKIQDAIDAAATGSVILVKKGTYAESLSLGSGKRLLIKGGYNSTEYDQQTANTTFIRASGPTTIKASSGSLKFQMINIEVNN